MANSYFRFKQFTINQDRCAMKVTTDGCLFGAWVASQLKDIPATNGLDIGAGTGLLSLMVAQQTALHLDAVEIDAAAATQAAQNFAESPWANRLQVQQTDIRQFIPSKQYDVICSNPPFYENELASPKTGRSIAHHGSGLRLLELLAQVNRLLADDGTAYLLFTAKRDADLGAALAAAGLFVQQKIVVHPSETHPSFRLMLAVKKNSVEQTAEQTVYIKDKEGYYTPAATSLLQDYYLFL
ncbi:tRNA1(Val) (adenine(37)-N6)-methyltransferase [Paracnuella aquatica]|uniref:tRNA1(Val) (adenine(37)-N6)-methyltransferase n=1 Tax=Paracnuella aquatica TaxID=2268757 RepID=UPI000DEFBD05|nr:methyltransferase [Paracnuella aquatica]RPD51466.1 methyltransferase domain-containing protein [Paracnuella aquatica]